MIKKVLPLILFFFTSFSLYSQINKGQWLTGGVANFSYSNVGSTINQVKNTYKSTSVQFSPSIGYFIINQLCAGLRVGGSASENKKINDGQKAPFPYYYYDDSKVTAISFSPFVRYYFLDQTHKINILADISYSYNYNKEKSQITSTSTDPNNGQFVVSSSSNNDKYYANSFTIAAGPALFLNTKTSLELTLGYSYSKYFEWTSNSLLIGAGFQFHFGKLK